MAAVPFDVELAERIRYSSTRLEFARSRCPGAARSGSHRVRTEHDGVDTTEVIGEHGA